MSEYTEALMAVKERLRVYAGEIAAETGLIRNTAERIINGRVDTPRYATANLITKYMIHKINVEIIRLHNEMLQLRQMGEELQRAHAATYAGVSPNTLKEAGGAANDRHLHS